MCILIIFHFSLLFSIVDGSVLLIPIASYSCLSSGLLRHLSTTFIAYIASLFGCSSFSCFHNTDFSTSLFNYFPCSSPLVYPSCSVSLISMFTLQFRFTFYFVSYSSCTAVSSIVRCVMSQK